VKSGKKLLLAGMAGLMIFGSGCADKQMKEPKQKTNQQENKEDNKQEFSIIKSKKVKISHLHGLGYPGNDDSLYIATHNGLKMFDGKNWSETSSNNNDYMGFQAVRDGFLASGHPQKGSGLKNPLGLIQSTDKGKTLKKLVFYGESDFHFLSASYSGNEVYIINEQPNSKIDAGIYFSKDLGRSWKKSKLTGFTADSFGMIAVHPDKGDTMAMATRNGIFYSVDSGNTMKAITSPDMVTALTFSGDWLYYCSVGNNTVQLKKLDTKTQTETEVKIPFLDYNNPITYLAADLKNPQRMAFSTYNNDIYETRDGGMNWTALLQNGQNTVSP